MNQEKIGKFIAKLRKEKKMTQQELAQKLNVTDKAVSKWENGRCLMDIALLKPLSKCLDVSIIELINGEKIETKDVSTKSNETVYKTLSYAENLRKNKFKVILGTILSMILIICLVYVSYKGVLLMIHKVPKGDIEEIISGLEVKSTLTIYKRTIDEDKYLVVDDIKIRNDFKDFEEMERPNELHPVILKKTLDNGKTLGVSISSGNSYIDIFSSDDVIVYNGIDSDTIDFGQFNAADRKYFLLRNDINNDIDLLNYIYKNGYHKSNIFMTDREIKENYAINFFMDTVIPKIDNITLITGDYSGYIFNLKGKSVGKNIRCVSILRNNKIYSFTFYGDKYDDEYLIDVLGTLEIK